MIRIVYQIECHCGEMATVSTMDLDNPEPDGSILLDIEMVACQQDFHCNACGCVTGTGDLEIERVPDPLCQAEGTEDTDTDTDTDKEEGGQS